MKYFLTFITTLSLSSTVYAQDFVITLNPVEDTVLQKRNFYFDAVEDAREQNQGKRIVGHFGKNDKTTAILDNDMEAFFLGYLNKVYPKRNTDTPLTLRVNIFECSSTGGMLSEAKVKLDFDILNSTTSELVKNITVERLRQPLMGGKTFHVLIEEAIGYGAGMIKM